MYWTPELDATLAELHGKRLGTMFIASWMRLRPSEVRARLAVLGLRPSAPARAGMRAAQVSRPVAGPSATVAGSVPDEDDEDDMVRRDGRPRGYLMSNAEISELFRRAGRGY
jgi:hypothetical protein